MKKRKCDANHGGVGPFWRCIASKLAHSIPGPLDFGGCVWNSWLMRMVDCRFWPLDWSPGLCGKPACDGVWWSFDDTLHRSILWRKIWNIQGDLGIEPRSQYLRATSFANWTNAFSCMFSGQWLLYVKNKRYWQTQKSRAKIQTIQSCWDTSTFFFVCLEIQNR